MKQSAQHNSIDCFVPRNDGRFLQSAYFQFLGIFLKVEFIDDRL